MADKPPKKGKVAAAASNPMYQS
jgi:hypothetical protein